MRPLPKYILLLLLLSLLSCCRRGTEVDFVRIEAMIDASPGEAAAMLDSIDREGLTDADRHHADLLSIRARDKAYVVHTSDSLILDVVGYYSSHRDRHLYPMALYYGGRVYSDMGDFPTALRYFQSALDVIPDDRENLRLKAVALSQTGRLLDNLRLHSEAIPYLEKSIEIEKRLNDTFGLAYDYDLLSQIYMKSGDLTAARRYNAEAIRAAADLPLIDQLDMEVDLASILYREKKIDSALQIIRGLPDRVEPLCREYTLSIAAQIYAAASIPDTAYMYARELAISRGPYCRTGFRVMFLPTLAATVPKDTLLHYIPLYNRAIENHLNTYEATEALIQNSQYNYQLHLRAEEKAEAGRNRLYLIVCIVSALAAAAVIGLLWLRMRSLREIVRLQRALDTIRTIRQSQDAEPTAPAVPVKTDPETLRGQILHEFESLGQTDSTAFTVKERIILSDTYRRLESLIEKEKPIPASGKMWDELMKLVAADSPDFRTRLDTLTNCKISDSEFQIALLTRCGISPSKIAILLNRTKSTVSSHRSALCGKIFGSGANIKLLDRLILYL